MMRSCALLVAVAALVTACGKYGPPRRVRPQPEPAVERNADSEPAEAEDDQEEGQ